MANTLTGFLVVSALTFAGCVGLDDVGSLTQAAVGTGTGTSCTPSCTGKTCGGDGCGGSCGTCPAGQPCRADGKCGCATDADCNDGISCTTDRCVNGSCSFTPDNTKCGDGVACTNDVCDVTVGCKHTPDNAKCDDKIACTNDVCDPTLGCKNTPDDSKCDDNNKCTTNKCAPGNPKANASGCMYPPDYAVIGAQLDAMKARASSEFARQDSARLGHTIASTYPGWCSWCGPDPQGNACTNWPNCRYGGSCEDSSGSLIQSWNGIERFCFTCGLERRKKEVYHTSAFYQLGYQGCLITGHWHPYTHTTAVCQCRDCDTKIEYMWDNWDGKGINAGSPASFRSEYPTPF